jgi:predicted PurR-regulated permease PerM
MEGGPVTVRSVYYGLVLFAATCLTLWGLGLILSPFLVPIAWALCLVTVTGGLYRRLAARTGRPRLAAFLLTLGVATCVLVPLVALGGAVVGEAITLSERAGEDRAGAAAPTTGDAWDDFFAQHENLQAIKARIDGQLGKLKTDLRSLKDAALKQIGQPVATGAVGVLTGLGSGLFGFLIMLATLYFLLRDGAAFRALVVDLVPIPEAETVRLLDTLRSTAFAAIVGGLATALIQGTLGGIALWITGVEGFVLWGFVMCLLSLLPVGGSAFVWAPVAIYFFAVDQAWKGVFLLAWGGLVIGSSDNLLRPYLMRKAGAESVHTLLLFFGILSGIGVFGVSGIVFGPLLVAFVVGVVRVYRDHYGHRARLRQERAGDASLL